MDTEVRKGGNLAAIITMFALFFMIAFVTNFASPMGVIAKNQFNASNALSQFGNFANFFAYLFMGIPGGLILKRKGYKFTALTAVAVGFTGLAVQLVSGYVSSFLLYVIGAFIAGFSMCMLNLVTNPLLNTLGGEGKKGNQLVQFGCSLNSVGATLSPMVLGWLIGEITKDTSFGDARPALLIAMGIFAAAFLIVALSKIPEPHMETAEEKAARLAGGASVVGDIVETLKFRHFT
ncbi:MAG: MFS transporter, partial [Kiritimatiellae bacterium]|nr:MFS transporter [Kiritimatiellia bacterium]